MKMVITGVSGFIGGRLLTAAREVHGNDVTAFTSRPDERPHIVYKNPARFELGAAELARISETEMLIHAGAFTPKNGAEANEISGSNSNIEFTQGLLSLPWPNLKKVVFLSTIDVYANAVGPIDESTPTAPGSLYGLSKLYCERLVTLTAAERGFSSCILRIGHVYGPGEERYAKVLPRAIQNIVDGKDVELWGDGAELRSFIYIDDVVAAILKAVELETSPDVINVVGGNAISIRNLLETLISISSRDVRIVPRPHVGRTRDFVFNTDRIKRHLLPEEYDLNSGLRDELAHVENNAVREAAMVLQADSNPLPTDS